MRQRRNPANSHVLRNRRPLLRLRIIHLKFLLTTTRCSRKKKTKLLRKHPSPIYFCCSILKTLFSPSFCFALGGGREKGDVAVTHPSFGRRITTSAYYFPSPIGIWVCEGFLYSHRLPFLPSYWHLIWRKDLHHFSIAPNFVPHFSSNSLSLQSPYKFRLYRNRAYFAYRGCKIAQKSNSLQVQGTYVSIKGTYEIMLYSNCLIPLMFIKYCFVNLCTKRSCAQVVKIPFKCHRVHRL